MEINLQKNYKHCTQLPFPSPPAQPRVQHAHLVEKKLALFCQGMKKSKQNTLSLNLLSPGCILFPGQSYLRMSVHTFLGIIREISEISSWGQRTINWLLSRDPATPGRARDLPLLGLEPPRFWIRCSRGSGPRRWAGSAVSQPTPQSPLSWSRRGSLSGINRRAQSPRYEFL